MIVCAFGRAGNGTSLPNPTNGMVSTTWSSGRATLSVWSTSGGPKITRLLLLTGKEGTDCSESVVAGI